MSRRQLALAWISTAVVFGALFVWGFLSWGTLDRRAREAASTRTQLTATVKAKQEEVLRELRSQGLVRDMQWNMERADPAVFLNGLAELARGTRLKILAVGPLERKATPQFVRSWQTVQVIAPFADFKELVARIERDRGLMEDVMLEISRETTRPGAPAAREIQARFKMTSLEVTGEARRTLQRALAVNRGGPGGPPAADVPAASPSLPVKAHESAGRDPFAFVVPAVATAPKKPAAPKKKLTVAAPLPATGSPVARPHQANAIPLAPMTIKGIVSLPDGYLAIVNNDIVRVGDLVENHRVEEITATTVLLRQPDGGPRLLTLPPMTPPARDGEPR